MAGAVARWPGARRTLVPIPIGIGEMSIRRDGGATTSGAHRAQEGRGVHEMRWQELTKDECFGLLAGRHLGRVVLVDDRGPIALPVNFVFDQHTVLFRSDEGTKLDVASRGARVAFEVDGVDEATCTGWSVLVRGEATEVSGANTSMIPTAQASAPNSGRATGPLTRSPRSESVSSVTGLTLTQACIQPGMVEVGTKALLAKVSGNSTVNPNTCTFSGSLTSMPISTGSHEKASVKPISRAIAPTALARPVWTRKPRIEPTPSRIPTDHACLTTSAAMRPASGAERAIGRLRKRSNTPLVMSVFSATAVFMVRNRAF